MTEDNQGQEQPKRLKPRGRLILVSVLLLILLSCLGLGVSSAFLRLRREGVWARWRRLEPMPARGVDLVTGDYRVVYVRTDAGNIYGCKHKGTRATRNRWYEAQEPLDVYHKATFDKRFYQGEVKPPAGTVVDTLGVTIWQAEDIFEARYVLLEDGSVFKWEYDVGAYWTIAILLFGIAIGGAVAVAGVIVLWVRARRQRSLSANA